MTTTFLSTVQYADKIKKCHRKTIWEAAKDNKLHLLPRVKKILKVGRDYLLEVEGKID